MKIDIAQISRAIALATDGELAAIIRAVNDATARKRNMMKNQFRVNEKVEFTGRDGLTVQGVIVKIMQKNVRVLQTNGRTVQWNVSPQLLRKAV